MKQRHSECAVSSFSGAVENNEYDMVHHKGIPQEIGDQFRGEREFVSSDECEKRLKRHLEFLMSDDTDSPNCRSEGIYVILFMLSNEEGIAGEIARKWVSSDTIGLLDSL